MHLKCSLMEFCLLFLHKICGWECVVLSMVAFVCGKTKFEGDWVCVVLFSTRFPSSLNLMYLVMNEECGYLYRLHACAVCREGAI